MAHRRRWRDLSARTHPWNSVAIRWVNSVSPDVEQRYMYRRPMTNLQEIIPELETRDTQQVQIIQNLIRENNILSWTNRYLKKSVDDLCNEIRYISAISDDAAWKLVKKEEECERMQDQLNSQKEDISRQIQSAIEFHNQKNDNNNIKLQRTVEELRRDKHELTENLIKIETRHKSEIDQLKYELRRELSHERDTRQNIENSALQKEVDRLHIEGKCLSKQLVSIKADADFKEKECARMMELLTQTNKENARLKSENQMLTSIRDKNSEQLLHEKTQLADALKHEKDSRKKQESYEISSFQQEIRELKTEAEQQHGKLKSLSDELTIAKENALKKAKECIYLQNILTEKDIEKANINEADEIQRKLREKISELEDKVDQLMDDKKKLTKELRDYKETLMKKDLFENTKLMEKNQELQNNFDRLYHENQSLHKQLIREKDNFTIKEKECIDMNRKMKAQKEHDVNLNATNVRAKQLDERNAELNNEIQRLLQERSNMTDELKQEREVRKRLEQYGNKTLQETNQTLQNEVTQLRSQNERLREDLTRERDNFKKKEIEFFKRSSDMKEKLEKQEQELVRLTTKLSEKSVLNRNVDPGAKKTQSDLQQQLDETRARLKNVQKELDDAKSRLSRAMGDKLTDNNPNIADLSDKNRPTKISERYQELYDNQWTDAFEIVNGKYRNEENTINILRDILIDTLEFCKTQAANQMIQIRASFLKGEYLPENMKKQVKECRKAMAELYGKGLYREYCDQLRTSKPESMSTPSYVKECFEICWLMAVQDPPVEFGPDLHRGDTFNKEHYRAYTRSGERVDFVVWPVLLLHQNGPVLCKGVAQGK